MNSNVAFEIVELALALAKSPAADQAAVLVKIAEKADEARRQHTGEALDPALIKTEDSV